MACFEEEGETVGAISYSSEFDFLPSEHGVLIHFNCEDIAQILEKVLQKGGKVVIPRTKSKWKVGAGLLYLLIARETGLVSMLKSN